MTPEEARELVRGVIRQVNTEGISMWAYEGEICGLIFNYPDGGGECWIENEEMRLES